MKKKMNTGDENKIVFTIRKRYACMFFLRIRQINCHDEGKKNKEDGVVMKQNANDK